MKDIKFDTYIGKELKKARENKKLSLVDVGKEINMSKQRLSNYETGIREVSVPEFILICKYYGINYHELMDRAYKETR